MSNLTALSPIIWCVDKPICTYVIIDNILKTACSTYTVVGNIDPICLLSKKCIVVFDNCSGGLEPVTFSRIWHLAY